METDKNLLMLASKYSSGLDSENIKLKINSLYDKYIRKNQEGILDSAAIAAALTIESLQEASDPMVLDAFAKQFPTKDIADLNDMSDTELQGIISGVKGKYFELLIADKLNNGEVVAGIQLIDGQRALLSEVPNQPGWDLKIVDEDGNTIDYLQAKATDSISYVKDAFDKYPDVDIISTSELADKFDLYYSDHVHVSDISNDSITRVAAENVDELSESFLADFIDNFNPLIPFGIIIISEGKNVLSGKTDFASALNSSKKRAVKSSAALAVGSALTALDFGSVSIPASIITRLSLDRIDNSKLVYFFFDKHINALNDLNRKRLINA